MKYIIILLLLSSCSVPLSISGPSAKEDHQDYPSSCKSPVYIATIAKTAKAGEAITLASLLTEAQLKFGADVTIHNVHFDVKAGKRISSIYDVIRCEQDKPTQEN